MKKIIGKQVNQRLTTHVRIDRGIHHLLKIKAATEKTTIRALLEGAAADVLEVKPNA